MSWLQYARTLRYLRPVQFYGFARHRLLRCLPAGPATVPGVRISECVQPPLVPFLSAPTSVHGTTFTFLNHTVDYPCGADWHDPAQTKLWRYNLHYMHYLHQPGITPQAQRDWMYAWVRGNSHPTGEGWEPYPTSLRLVNWFKSGGRMASRRKISSPCQCLCPGKTCASLGRAPASGQSSL